MEQPTRTGLGPQKCVKCHGSIDINKPEVCSVTGTRHYWSIMDALAFRKRPASLASRCECGWWVDIENGGISYDFGMGSRHSCYYETGVYSDGTEVEYGWPPATPLRDMGRATVDQDEYDYIFPEDQSPTESPPDLHIGDVCDEHDDEVSP